MRDDILAPFFKGHPPWRELGMVIHLGPNGVTPDGETLAEALEASKARMRAQMEAEFWAGGDKPPRLRLSTRLRHWVMRAWHRGRRWLALKVCPELAEEWE